MGLIDRRLDAERLGAEMNPWPLEAALALK